MLTPLNCMCVSMRQLEAMRGINNMFDCVSVLLMFLRLSVRVRVCVCVSVDNSLCVCDYVCVSQQTRALYGGKP